MSSRAKLDGIRIERQIVCLLRLWKTTPPTQSKTYDIKARHCILARASRTEAPISTDAEDPPPTMC